MIPIKEWVNNLIAMCARTDTTNVFRHDQVMDKNILIKNYDIDYSEAPTQSSTGTTHSIVMVDKDNNTLGSIDFFRTNTEALGLRFNIKNYGMGFKITDENIPVSFVNHPDPDGEDTQIATIGYVDNQVDNLSETISQLEGIVTNSISGFNTTLLAKIAELKAYVDTQDAAIRALITALTTRVSTLENTEEEEDEDSPMTVFRERLATVISSGFLWSINSIGCLRLVYIRESSEDFAVHSLKAGDTIDPSKYVIWMAGAFFQFNDDDVQYIYPNGGTHDTGDYAAYNNSRITVGTWKLLSPYYSQGTAVRVYMARLCLIVRIG